MCEDLGRPAFGLELCLWFGPLSAPLVVWKSLSFCPKDWEKHTKTQRNRSRSDFWGAGIWNRNVSAFSTSQHFGEVKLPIVKSEFCTTVKLCQNYSRLALPEMPSFLAVCSKGSWHT